MKKTKSSGSRYLLFSLPSIIVILAIMIFPVCYAIYYSFFQYKMGGTATFIGLKNYIKILTDSEFQEALLFSVIYTAITVSAQIILGMIIALLMDNIRKGRRVIATLIYLPYFIAGSICGIIFRWIFISNWGLVPQFLSSIGISAPSFFDNAGLSRMVGILAEIWQNTPFATIIFYAGLQSVPYELEEAAQLDGATEFQIFRNIKLPHLRHLFILVLTMRTMDSFRVYDRIAVMTAGGPGTATQTVSLYAYKYAFTKLRIGRGCAAGVLILLVMAIPIFILLKKMRSTEVD